MWFSILVILISSELCRVEASPWDFASTGRSVRNRGVHHRYNFKTLVLRLESGFFHVQIFDWELKVVYEKRWKPHGLMHGEETDADGMMVYDRRSPPPTFEIPPLEESDGSEFWVTPLLDPFQNLFLNKIICIFDSKFWP